MSADDTACFPAFYPILAPATRWPGLPHASHVIASIHLTIRPGYPESRSLYGPEPAKHHRERHERCIQRPARGPSSSHRTRAIHRRLGPAGTGLRPFPARGSGARRDRGDRHQPGIGEPGRARRVLRRARGAGRLQEPAADHAFQGQGRHASSRSRIGHALAHERVRFVGEPVALVVAETEAAAQDAAERIDRRLSRPAGAGRCRGCARGRRRRSSMPTCRATWRSTTSTATARRSMKPSPRRSQVVRVTLEAQRIAGNPMEPKACLMAYDPRTGMHDIYLPTQGASDIRAELAYVTGIAEREVSGPRPGRRRRIRRPQRNLSGIRRRSAGDPSARPAGEMDRHARRDRS